jgi:cyclophilin family peptidyl-prolyl cis-trans isomerase
VSGCAGLTFGPALAATGASGQRRFTEPPTMQIDARKRYQAVITTGKGTITLCLDPALAPKTVNNFVFLARNLYYDGLTFHRVVPGFVIQGGCPRGDGTGGPGYKFQDEPVQEPYVEGAVAMANSGPNTNGSQFFITNADASSLPRQYNLFGHVEQGIDVVKAIKVGDVMQSVTVHEQT